MKTLKVSLLALSVLAGGIAYSAKAASTPEIFNVYGVEMDWGNATNSQAGTETATIWSIFDGPSTTPETVFPQLVGNLSVNTDASGKLSGAGWMYIYYGSNVPPYTALLVEVSGNVTGKDGQNVKVKMTVKGGGFTVLDSGTNTGTNAAAASISITFDGAPGPNPNTNCTQKLLIAGTLKGSVKGQTPQDSKTYKVDGRAATIGSPGSCFGASRDFFYIDASVISNAKKFNVYGDVFEQGFFNGNGTVKGTTYKFNGKGIGFAKGASFSVDGNLTTSTTNVVVVGTNPPVNVIIITPGTANLKGKALGQTVSGASQSIQAN